MTDADLPLLMVRVLKMMVAELTATAGRSNDAGFTPVHGLALRFVAEHEAPTMVQLAAHLAVTKQSASEIVSLLEEHGLVRRLPHPQDGRARILELTADGRAGLERSRALWGDLVLRWSAAVGTDDLAVVRRALEGYLSAASSTSP